MQLDEEGRVRIDDWEMRAGRAGGGRRSLWPRGHHGNLDELTDIAGYRSEFLKLFGFGLPGIDYDADVDPEVALES